VPPARLALPVLTVALLAGGCLGGGSGSSSSSGQLTKAQYSQQASAICRSYKKKIAALPTPADLKKLAQSGEKAIALQQQELDELARLRPPEAIGADVRQMLAAVQRGVQQGSRLVLAAQQGNRTEVKAAAGGLQAQLEQANEIARRLDLGDCVISA
jgi:hypothetical protein